MSNMMPDLEGYFRGLAPGGDALLLELEEEAERESTPIVGPVVGIWMNMVSVESAPAGVAMALVARFEPLAEGARRFATTDI